MAYGRTARLLLWPWLLVVGAAACRPVVERLDREQWRQAEAQWRRGDGNAFATWRRLDPAQPYGRAARARLDQADRDYRRAVELLRDEQPDVRATLAAALALGPMDPALYLPFARACRERGLWVRAADFYRKYLARNSASAETEVAAAELAALSGDLPNIGEGGSGPVEGARAWWAPALALAGAGLLLLVLAGLVARGRRGGPLRELVRERPEIHQAIAYQIGCLRHELLKHRIAAAGEALAAVAEGRGSDEQRRFLEERLCRGEPLLLAWRAHLRELERVLGPRAALVRTDPLFRGAERALRLLSRAAGTRKPGDGRRVGQARESLQRFDRELGELVAGLAHCPLDDRFLAEVLASTRAEWSSGKVELDEVAVGPVPEDVAVDVYRTDLRIVLKNILRNAIAALAASPHPRRLAIDVQLELEPTGEEVVRIRVRDSSGSPLATLWPADGADVGRGLGIVQTALLRYDGSLAVVPGGEGYAKAVVVRLFRSQNPPGTLGEAA